MKTRLLLVFALALLCWTGCDSNDDDFNIEDYLGTYTGTLTAGGIPLGTISHTFTADLAAGTVTLVTEQDGILAGAVLGDVEGEIPEDIPLEVTGTFDENGIVFDQSIPELELVNTLTIHADGRVTGQLAAGVLDEPITMDAAGTITPSRFDLEMTIIVPELRVEGQVIPPPSIS